MRPPTANCTAPAHAMRSWRACRALARLGRQPARSCGAFRMVPSPLQGTSQSTRSNAPPSAGSAVASWWMQSPAGCRTRRTWWASMQHRRPSSSLDTTAPPPRTSAAETPSRGAGAAPAASMSCRVFMPGEAQTSSTRRPAPPPRSVHGTMETASCREITPSVTQRFMKPCSRFGPGAFRSTALGMSSLQAPGSQAKGARGSLRRAPSTALAPAPSARLAKNSSPGSRAPPARNSLSMCAASIAESG
mmetsp:Transcript_59485/g.174578  ORF Transcript_59485/g.174578 Transcript_59485/m.174578 type:complete len:247 (-) Transcript_59485:309-1049(-)